MTCSDFTLPCTSSPQSAGARRGSSPPPLSEEDSTKTREGVAATISVVIIFVSIVGAARPQGPPAGDFCVASFSSHRHTLSLGAFSSGSLLWGMTAGGGVVQQLPLCFLISCSYIIYLVMQHDAPIKLPLRHAGRKDQCLTPLGHDGPAEEHPRSHPNNGELQPVSLTDRRDTPPPARPTLHRHTNPLRHPPLP